MGYLVAVVTLLSVSALVSHPEVLDEKHALSQHHVKHTHHHHQSEKQHANFLKHQKHVENRTCEFGRQALGKSHKHNYTSLVQPAYAGLKLERRWAKHNFTDAEKATIAEALSHNETKASNHSKTGISISSKVIGILSTLRRSMVTKRVKKDTAEEKEKVIHSKTDCNQKKKKHHHKKASAFLEKATFDPHCRAGLMNTEMTACCQDDCGECSDSSNMCNDRHGDSSLKGRETTCCPATMLAGDLPSCEFSMAPCAVPDYVRSAPDISDLTSNGERNAADDCLDVIPEEDAMQLLHTHFLEFKGKSVAGNEAQTECGTYGAVEAAAAACNRMDTCMGVSVLSDTGAPDCLIVASTYVEVLDISTSHDTMLKVEDLAHNKFEFKPQPWGACSKSCDGGETNRELKCFATSGVEVPLGMCSTQVAMNQDALPPTTGQCNVFSCHYDADFTLPIDSFVDTDELLEDLADVVPQDVLRAIASLEDQVITIVETTTPTPTTTTAMTTSAGPTTTTAGPTTSSAMTTSTSYIYDGPWDQLSHDYYYGWNYFGYYYERTGYYGWNYFGYYGDYSYGYSYGNWYYYSCGTIPDGAPDWYGYYWLGCAFGLDHSGYDLAGEWGSGTEIGDAVFAPWLSLGDMSMRWYMDDGRAVQGPQDCFPGLDGANVVVYIPEHWGADQLECELMINPNNLMDNTPSGYCMYMVGAAFNTDLLLGSGNMQSLVDDNFLLPQPSIEDGGLYSCSRGKMWVASDPFMYGWAWYYVNWLNGMDSGEYYAYNPEFQLTINAAYEGEYTEWRDQRQEWFTWRAGW